MLPLLLSSLVIISTGLAHLINPLPVPRRDLAVVNRASSHHSGSVADLSFDEFIAEVSRLNKLTSPALQKRHPVYGEVKNTAAINNLLGPAHDACNRARPGTRCLGGYCDRNTPHIGRVTCHRPTLDELGDVPVETLECPQGKKCVKLKAFNFRSRAVYWPTCGSEFKVDRPVQKNAPPDTHYEGQYWFSALPFAPGLENYFVEMGWESQGLGGSWGEGPSSSHRQAYFHDTAGISGWGRTWSCFHCPPGLMTVYSQVPADGYAYEF